MKLLIIFGPPAVGKLTVGKAIEEQTDFHLFHNHAIMDDVMHIFGTGTPAEDRLSRVIRENVIEEAAKTGIDLIFTYVWNFGLKKGKYNIDRYKEIYESRGGNVYFAELVAPAAIRIKRAASPERQVNKAHAAKAEEIAKLDSTKDFRSPSPFFYPNMYKQIGTSDKTPRELASQIIGWVS
ncbi:MAG TPA: hypothetical protein VGG13_02810 [Candidatus Saccharimonadales bacterium]